MATMHKSWPNGKEPRLREELRHQKGPQLPPYKWREQMRSKRGVKFPILSIAIVTTACLMTSACSDDKRAARERPNCER